MSYVAWQFQTARFMVRLHIEEEEADPRDHFDDEETVKDIAAGRLDWFSAHVAIYLDGSPVADEYLGACSYVNPSDFWCAHRSPVPMERNCTEMRAECGQNTAICHYFPEMVRTACKLAREEISKKVPIKLRKH